MMFGEEEMAFHFAKLKKRPYEVEDIKEEKTVAELATIHFSTPQDELERSLINWEEAPDDEEREKTWMITLIQFRKHKIHMTMKN